MSRSNKARKLNNADALPNVIYNGDGSPVGKVCFSFKYDGLTAQQNITKSLLGYVIGIGRIESWHLWSSATYTIGNIQFEQPEHAAQLLNQSGGLFEGAFVHFWNYMDMLSLPDKCLQEIFRNLDLNDLVSVAQVNERFKQNAKSIFSLKFGSFNISIRAGNKESNQWMNDIHRLETFLPLFGEFVVKIDFDFSAFDSSSINRAMELFTLHCSNLLKSLSLWQFPLEDALVSTIEPIFARLTKLEVNRCGVSNRFIESLARCRELNVLRIWDTTGDFQSFQFTLAKLEAINFGNVSGLNQHQMEIFLRQNPQLKDVFLSSRGRVWSVFSAIGQYLPQVEELDFRVTNFIDQPTFSRNAFASLKKLKIDTYMVPASATISALAAAQVPLEYLSLLCFPDDRLIDAISELKTIKTLFLRVADYSISRLLRIIDNLKELDYLKFDRCDTLNADGLVEIIRNAKKLQQLDLWLNRTVEINTATCAALVEILKKRDSIRHLRLFTNKESRPSNPDPTHREFLTLI